MIDSEVINKLRREEVDVNRHQLFFKSVIKGLIYDLNDELILRDVHIPHYIVNTGDDIMYLEVKGQDHSIEPVENSNEKFVYTMVPRCTIQPNDIAIQTDQLTSPYTKGNFQVSVDDILYGVCAEFRRLPVTVNVSLTYILDNYIDCLDVVQQIFSKLAFIRTYTIIYLGQTITCSYTIPDSTSVEKIVEFDGVTADSKTRTISVDLAVESSLPVIDSRTIMAADGYIKVVSWSPDMDYEWNHAHENGIKLYPKGQLIKGPHTLAVAGKITTHNGAE